MPPPEAEDERQAGIAARLSHLLKTQEWDTLEEQLIDLESRAIEGLCTAQDDWRFYQGRIQGIREARMLPRIWVERVKP